MKKYFTLLLFLLIVTSSAFALKKSVLVSCSEPDAKIYQDGKYIGTGQVEIVIVSKSCANIESRKIGYLTEKVKFCNNRYSARPPKTYYIEMRRDDSYDASIQTDIANSDIELKTSKAETDAWKLISQIVTSSFDVIEITDKETGYLRTAWVAQSFDAKTIRTRFIVKQASVEPLVYKIKLVSEHSDFKGTSIKKDEDFREWDRVLRKYENLISELTSRLK
ncbi:hypothetical protein [Ancylomarina longa]|uniref:PEGA domain-containing protein n=1 Tax=Ancylomarina longa TaxID=2487017 RepID=A0A434AFI9_9BACT|nr:hypothetical protein [Ancylomarina longa]RUT73147.1 hypothetical protein DLK05_14790 [Ancylomarina longa]